MSFDIGVDLENPSGKVVDTNMNGFGNIKTLEVGPVSLHDGVAKSLVEVTIGWGARPVSVETGIFVNSGVVNSTLIFYVKYCCFLHLKMDNADGTVWVLRIWTHQLDNASLLVGR